MTTVQIREQIYNGVKLLFLRKLIQNYQKQLVIKAYIITAKATTKKQTQKNFFKVHQEYQLTKGLVKEPKKGGEMT